MPVPVIALSNASTVLTDIQVQAVIPALQKQVTDDFRAYWNIDATLTFLPKGQPLPKGWWQIVIIDNPDMAGALGYHELSSQGTPLGKVFAKLDLDHGLSWSVTLSHELLEMLGDPFINWTAQGDDGQIYALEVADAVEADELGYKIGDVLVSDFVTPKWFNDYVGNDRYSFKQRVHKPLELAPGGYISILDPNKGWIQITAQKDSAETLPPPVGSRRQRRTMQKADWQRSEPTS